MSSVKKQHSQQIYCVSGRDDCAREEQRIHDLEISEARYQNLFEAVTDALISVDRDGLINRANSSCQQVFRWSPSELLGKKLASLFQGYPQVVQAFLKTLQGEGQDLELPFDWATGQQVVLALRLSAITDGEDVSGALIVARDLSKEKARELERQQLYENLLASHREQKEKAQALEDSRRQLQEAMARQEKLNAELREIDRMKSDFIGLASHELTTPLTFLLGALEFLEERLPGRINEDEQSLLDYAMQGSQRLADIVENMLDIVRLDADGFHPQRESVSLCPLLTHVRSNIAKGLKERELALDCGENEDWPALSIDPGLLRRALEDLLGNAIKYTEEGGEIRVSGQVRSLESLAADAEQIRLFYPEFPENVSWEGTFFEVCVVDNGIGIPRQELPHVFERFYTVGNIEEHSSGDGSLGSGAGLGLALVKRIVHGHGGLSWASSPGSSEETGLNRPGSCFHLLLPHEASRAG